MDGPFETIWLIRELLSSRLAADESPGDAATWIDLDAALGEAGATLSPGETALPPRLVGQLHRWRLAGIRPLLATCTVDPEMPRSQARAALLEIDALTGGGLDGIRALFGLGKRTRDASSSPLPATQTPAMAAEAEAAEAIAAEAIAAEAIAAEAKRPRRAERLRRVRGALLGLAAGDCLGAPVENWTAEKIARIHGPFRDFVSGRGWGPGHPTRETTLALMWFGEIAEGRTVHAAADRNRLGAALAGWVAARPRDFGHLTRGILRSYGTAAPVPSALSAWERARRTPEFNGALSRAAAIGAALHEDRDLCLASACAASAMTHPAPVCLAAAIALAEGVAAAVRDESPLEAAIRITWEQRVSMALDEVAGGWSPGGAEWSSHDRGHVLNTLRVAFWAAHQRRPMEDLLLEIVHHGGDADTHAAAAGALLGARDGPEALPERWIAALRIKPVVESLIEKVGRG
ncbi:MAG: ADP-ribosylglycohydrolase family protein [Candidatus Eisenbacteria bacterium]|nr:ADP-ribosylglycohydrolase family protein [Candidatus Eisenbacteria bacterium]